MTIVFERHRDGPATHALVVGCGHFPHLPGAPKHDRPACPDSARAVVEFLVDHQDDLLVPLASITCLITEASGNPGTVEHSAKQFDPRRDTIVERANRKTLFDLGSDWVARCKPEDHLFFYACSHGIAERDGSVFLLLEDIHERANAKWANALDVRALAKELPAFTGAGACWVFLDACQELIEDSINQIDGLTGWKLVNASVKELARSRTRSASLAAARFGGFAQAPAAGGVAHFTRALLDALGSCCVERTPGGWAVSAKEVLFGVRQVAEIAYGQIAVDTIPLEPFNDTLYFLNVQSPQVPVLVTSVPNTLLSDSESPKVHRKGTNIEIPTAKPTSPWRFRVPIDAEYTISLGAPTNRCEDFVARPPAVSIEVRQ